jgi:hypothetical protein
VVKLLRTVHSAQASNFAGVLLVALGTVESHAVIQHYFREYALTSDLIDAGTDITEVFDAVVRIHHTG